MTSRSPNRTIRGFDVRSPGLLAIVVESLQGLAKGI
jgi:hypothetical protein